MRRVTRPIARSHTGGPITTAAGRISTAAIPCGIVSGPANQPGFVDLEENGRRWILPVAALGLVALVADAQLAGPQLNGEPPKQLPMPRPLPADPSPPAKPPAEVIVPCPPICCPPPPCC